MCHPYLFINGNNGIPNTGRVFPCRYYRTNCGSNYMNIWSDFPSGLATRYKRSACVHTVADQYGWRPPKPYTFMLHELEPPKGARQANSKSCPTIVVEGIRQTVQSVWPYDPKISQITPYERLAGVPKANQLNWVRSLAIASLDRSDLNLGETFLERKQTYQMVLGFIRDIIWFWRRLREGGIPLVRKLYRNVDPWKLYLEYRYGWKPLYNDIMGMLEWIELRDAGTYNKYRIRVRKTKSYPFSESGSRAVDQSTFSYTISGNETVKVRYYYTPKAGGATYITLASLGITPNALWETLPYSFVVDWFINVGTFLEGWAMLPGWDFVSGTETTFGKYEGNGSFGPGAYPDVTSTPIKGKWVSFDRRVVTAPPRPSLAINPDILIGRMSNVRIADAVALLMQAHGKTVRTLSRNLRKR